VDGSGVLYDPLGIDRSELLRLANKRAMVQEFDKSKLSKGIQTNKLIGFSILIFPSFYSNQIKNSNVSNMFRCFTFVYKFCRWILGNDSRQRCNVTGRYSR
jgi:hypothetical protein